MNESKRVLLEPIVLLIACGVVGGLAARGSFMSMMNFPLIFGLVCLFFGVLSLRKQPRVALLPRAVLVVLGAAIAIGGWQMQVNLVEQRHLRTQKEVFAELGGKAAPALTGLEPLNTEAAALGQAASFSNAATIVTFWARWCSPCWKELPELDEFYRERRADGLAVVAIAEYDEPTDESVRQEEFLKGQEFVRDHDLTFPAAMTTDDGLFRSYRVRSLPSAALIDAQGTLVGYGVGVDGGREIMRYASALLEGRKPPDPERTRSSPRTETWD